MNIFGSLSSQANLGVAKILKIIANHKWERKKQLKNQGFIFTMEVQIIVVMVLN